MYRWTGCPHTLAGQSHRGSTRGRAGAAFDGSRPHVLSGAAEQIEMGRDLMLREIRIKNFVLFEDMRLEFDKGLNVLTGETGAGKSIVLDALGLLLGDR